MSVLRARRFRINTRFYRHIRFVRIRACALTGRLVHDFTRKDVSFCHGVGGRKGLTLARSQAANCPFVAGQFIRHHDIGDGQVAVIGHRDRVFDRFIQAIFITLVRFTRGNLVDLQVTVLSFRHYCCFRLLGNIAKGCGHSICEGTIQNIGFLDDVGRGCRYGFTRFNILKYALFKCHAFDFTQRDRLSFFVDVRRRHSELHGVS